MVAAVTSSISIRSPIAPLARFRERVVISRSGRMVRSGRVNGVAVWETASVTVPNPRVRVRFRMVIVSTLRLITDTGAPIARLT